MAELVVTKLAPRPDWHYVARREPVPGPRGAAVLRLVDGPYASRDEALDRLRARKRWTREASWLAQHRHGV